MCEILEISELQTGNTLEIFSKFRGLPQIAFTEDVADLISKLTLIKLLGSPTGRGKLGKP